MFIAWKMESIITWIKDLKVGTRKVSGQFFELLSLGTYVILGSIRLGEKGWVPS
jgi:hypothetical protein